MNDLPATDQPLREFYTREEVAERWQWHCARWTQ